MSMPKDMREKGVQRCPPKKRKRKKHSPSSSYFLENNDIHGKGVQIGLENISHTCTF
jgi:hypothetical protein